MTGVSSQDRCSGQIHLVPLWVSIDEASDVSVSSCKGSRSSREELRGSVLLLPVDCGAMDSRWP